MKRVIIIFLFILMATGFIYFFIPSEQNFYYHINTNCSGNAVERFILNNEKWKRWWPGKQSSKDVFKYKNYDYKINKILLDGFEVTILNDKNSVTGSMQVISLTKDTTEFRIRGTFVYSINPVKRILQYFQCNNIKTNIKSLLDDLKKYFENQENVYGFKVEEQKVKDSSLVVVKQSFTHYPTTLDIYNLIASLKQYIKEKGGEEVNYPMLNVYTEDSINYEAMIAIATQNDLPSQGKFQLKKMVLGNILVAQVKGGTYTIIKGERELKNYVTDYQKISPAIPYQLLVTNRLNETDTTKWITQLYYPVF